MNVDFFMDVSIADQAEHWIHSVLAVLPDSKVVSSIPPPMAEYRSENSLYNDGDYLCRLRFIIKGGGDQVSNIF